MPAVNIVESRKSIQYTGSNSAEIDAAITDLTIDSEGGGVLNVTSSSTPFVVNTGDWINYWQGYINGVYTNSQFNFFFLANAVSADLTGLASDLDALESLVGTIGGQAIRSAGVASAGTLLLGIPQNVAVALVPAMPNTSYTAAAYVFGTGVNLSQVSINSITNTSASVVTVNVSTGLASLPGVHILVTVRA